MKLKRLLSPSHLQRGADAEKSAVKHLKSNGLQLLQRNYRCAAGEIDIVMQDQQELVFVEVRYRSSDQFGGAASSVDSRKQRKLRMTGESFLQRHPSLRFTGCRFDVVAIDGADHRIDWIRDAF